MEQREGLNGYTVFIELDQNKYTYSTISISERMHAAPLGLSMQSKCILRSPLFCPAAHVSFIIQFLRYRLQFQRSHGQLICNQHMRSYVFLSALTYGRCSKIQHWISLVIRTLGNQAVAFLNQMFLIETLDACCRVLRSFLKKLAWIGLCGCTTLCSKDLK